MISPKIPKNSAKQAIIKGILPKYEVDILNIPFTLHFLDIPLTSSAFAQLEFFEKVVSFNHLSGDLFVRQLPPVYYQEILKRFLENYSEITEILVEQLNEFVETTESRNYWQLCKSTRLDLIINVENELNFLQQQWILINTQKDKKEMATLISQIFDAAKPWLNPELYNHVKEVEENQRENRFYDVENISREDQRLREKAAKMFKKANPQLDLDEISIETDNGR